MVAGLTCFWIEFDWSVDSRPPAGTRIGVGVTAIDRADALRLTAHRVFSDGPLPAIREIREGVDVSSLDAGHVRSKMGPPHVRGVWFPLGY
jgi:hypothetical protein